MTEVSGSDFSVVVYRQEVVTLTTGTASVTRSNGAGSSLWGVENALVRPRSCLPRSPGTWTALSIALRQQPSIGETIGLAAVGDDFFVAIRVIGTQVSVFLPDLTASVDWPLARQVLDYLDIPVPR